MGQCLERFGVEGQLAAQPNNLADASQCADGVLRGGVAVDGNSAVSGRGGLERVIVGCDYADGKGVGWTGCRVADRNHSLEDEDR